MSEGFFVLMVGSLPVMCNSFLFEAPPLHSECGVDPRVFAFDIVGMCALHTVSVFWVVFTGPNLAVWARNHRQREVL